MSNDTYQDLINAVIENAKSSSIDLPRCCFMRLPVKNGRLEIRNIGRIVLKEFPKPEPCPRREYNQKFAAWEKERAGRLRELQDFLAAKNYLPCAGINPLGVLVYDIAVGNYKLICDSNEEGRTISATGSLFDRFTLGFAAPEISQILSL